MMKGAKNGTSQQVAIRLPHAIVARARQQQADSGLSLARVLVEAIDAGLALRAPAPANTPASDQGTKSLR